MSNLGQPSQPQSGLATCRELNLIPISIDLPHYFSEKQHYGQSQAGLIER